MLHFIILDDDATHNLNTKKRLEQMFEMNDLEASIALNTTRPSEVIEYCSKNSSRNNVYLLDVDVQCRMNGIDVAGIIREHDAKAYIVFVSGHPEYVMQSLKTKVFDYLIKPISTSMLKGCINSVFKDFDKIRGIKGQVLSIKSGFNIYNLEFDEIVYLEKFGHLLVTHTTLGEIESSESLDSIEQKLDPKRFVRCHKSYIVNISYISRIDYPNSMIYLKNGKTCAVSKRCKKELKEACSII